MAAPLLLAAPLLALTIPASPVAPEVWAGFTKGETQRVIVQVADPLGSRGRGPHLVGAKDEHAARVQAHRADLARRKAKILDAASRQLGRDLEARYLYPAFRLFAVDVDRAALAAIVAHPEVTRVFADREEAPQLDTSLPHAHVPEFHAARGRGEGTSVAILDSPVRYAGGHFGTCNQPGSIGCKLIAQLNFTDQSVSEVARFEDINGLNSHGTNVAAIAHGVAPEADVIGLNVFTGRSDGRLRAASSDVLQALNWVAFNAAAQNIVAANMSLGSEREDPSPCDGHAYADAIRTLYFDHDVLTVISSGNDAVQNAVGSPACVSLAVTVAAHFDTETARYSGYDCYQEDPRDQEMACFSNIGGLVDLVAPGVFVDAGGYKLSGTSMSAPHVTGAVALVQGDFIRLEGRGRSAHDVHRRLLLSAGRMVHIDGRIFPRLDMASSGAWDVAASFGDFVDRTAANRIPPSATTGLAVSVDVPDGPTLAGAYLYLQIDHPAPETLELALEGPGGLRAPIRLPAGQANFTGMIGRQFDVESLAGLAGASPVGTWTLTVRAPEGAEEGWLMAADLLLRNSDCTPECADAGCGDDGCGQRCAAGFCEINQRCYASGTIPADNPCLMCDPTASTASWGRSGDGCQIEGTCYEAGAPFDTIPCMSCRPDQSTSGWSPNAGFCVVAGACLEAGSKRPGSACRGCDPDQDPRAYSDLSGVTCDDEDACTTEDVCAAGRCEGTPVVCPDPGPCEASIACAATSGDCVTAPEPDGTACEGGGVCEAGVCKLVDDGGDEGGDGCTNTRGSAGALALLAGLLMLRRRDA